MATAVKWDLQPDAQGESGRNRWREQTEAYRLRSIPNEDVYFYSKRIDNSRLVKPVDVTSRNRAVGVMAGGVCLAVVAILLMLPHVMNTMAGIQIHELRAVNEELNAETSRIAYQIENYLTPERMKAEARQRGMVEPSPNQIHHINPAASQEVLEAKLKQQ